MKKERKKGSVKKKVMKDKYQYNQKGTSEPDKSSDAIIRQFLENLCIFNWSMLNLFDKNILLFIL
jgi:hypothetical protein